MATQIQYRRGTNAQNAAFTGALGEITVDTTNGTLRVHDGITAGGSNIATVSYVSAQISALSANSITDGTSNVKVFANGNVTTSVAGTANVLNVTSTGAIITGDLSVTGNATLSGNILGDRIQNGTTTIDIQTANGNANITVAGTSNVAVFASTGAFITGVTSVSGNITGGNILTAGLISATSTITSAANVIGGNISTAGLITATGNITGGNLRTAGLISATSTITSAANVIGGNISTAGLITATGNITAGNILTAGLISATSTITSAANVIGGNISTAGLITATGNIQGGNIRTAGIVSATSTVFVGADLTLTGNIVDTGALVVSTTSNANITLNAGTGFIIASSGILNGQANGTGNIGNSTGYFNTIFAKATSAQYADLAEMYVADQPYQPSTVVVFGGTHEVEISTASHANHVAGVVSTNPSYIMNAGQKGAHVVAVALQGRVPCQVVGPVRKGDRMVSSHIPGVATVLDPARYEPGCIIGKALTAHQPTFDQAGNEIPGMIEVVVGRV